MLLNDQTKVFTDCPTFKRPKERKQGKPISNAKRSLKLCHTHKNKTTSTMSKEAYKQNETKTKKMKRRVKVKLERKEKTKNKKETNNKSKQSRNKHTNKQTKLGLSKEVALLCIPNQSKLSIN